MKLSPIFNKNYPISQEFGKNPQIYSRFNLAGHNGLDFAIPEGEPVFSPIDGEVYRADYQATGYGKYLKLRNKECELVFGHLSMLIVKKGEVIKKGQLIGLSGNTGFSTGPHLHFGFRELKNKLVENYDNGFFGYVNPISFFENYSDSSLVYKEKSGFTNLAKNYDNIPEWAIEGYEFVIEEGISNGERSNFEISREEFWLMLLRFSEVIGEQWKLDKTFDLGVSDLDVADRPSEWAEDCYAFVVSENISNGERPKEYISREELWTTLFRFFEGYDKFKLSTRGGRVQGLSEWAVSPYYWVKTNSISNGERPKDFITRAEVWEMILNCFEVLED